MENHRIYIWETMGTSFVKLQLRIQQAKLNETGPKLVVQWWGKPRHAFKGLHGTRITRMITRMITRVLPTNTAWYASPKDHRSYSYKSSKYGPHKDEMEIGQKGSNMYITLLVNRMWRHVIDWYSIWMCLVCIWAPFRAIQKFGKAGWSPQRHPERPP